MHTLQVSSVIKSRMQYDEIRITNDAPFISINVYSCKLNKFMEEYVFIYCTNQNDRQKCNAGMSVLCHFTSNQAIFTLLHLEIRRPMI